MPKPLVFAGGVVVGLVALYVAMLAVGGGHLFGGIYSQVQQNYTQGLTAGQSGQFQVNSSGNMSFGSSTPSPLGDVVVESAGTSTVFLSSTLANTGGCLQLENSAGTQTKAYINGTSWVIAAGSCK